MKIDQGFFTVCKKKRFKGYTILVTSVLFNEFDPKTPQMRYSASRHPRLNESTPIESLMGLTHLDS